MAKFTPITTGSGFNLNAINENFQTIADLLNDQVLFRQNPAGEANQMVSTNIDMNENKIINLAAPVGATDAARLQDITDAIAAITGNEQVSNIVSLLDYNPKNDGTDDLAAFNSFVAALRTRAATGGLVYGYIPKAKNGTWVIDGELLINVSNLVLFIGGSISQISTSRNCTLRFSYDTNQEPAAALQNVAVYGVPGVTIDGNGQNMPFTFTPSDGSEDTSTVRFNYIDNLFFRGLHIANGPIDTCSVRKCRNWLGEQMEFTGAAQYDPVRAGNGFSATTDWDPDNWAESNPQVWGYGTLRNFISHDNPNGVGATSFNCSGVWFEDGKSYNNLTAFSYEKQAGVTASKNRLGGFRNCYGSTCHEGFVIDDNGITIDNKSVVENITASSASDPNNLRGNGVTLSACTNFDISPTIRNIAHAGIAMFNGVGAAMVGVVEPKIDTVGTYGIYDRGTSWLKVGEKTRILNASTYGIYAHNNGSEYNQGGTSTIILDNPWIELSKGSAAFIDYKGFVFINGLTGRNNCYNVTAGTGSGIQLANISTLARVRNVDLRDANGTQGFVLSLGDNVASFDEFGTQGDYTSVPVVGVPTISVPNNSRVYSATTGTAHQFQNISGTTGARVRLSMSVSPSNNFTGAYVDAERLDSTGTHSLIAGVFNGTSPVDMLNVTSSGVNIGSGTTVAKNLLDVGGSIGTGIELVSATQTLFTKTVETTLVDPTTASFTIAIDAAAANSRHKHTFVFQGTSTNTVTLNFGSALSDGTTSKVLSTSNRTVRIHALASSNIWALT